MLPVIIPTYKNKGLLDLCLQALEKSTIPVYPVVIDNSEDNLGFTKGMNEGIKKVDSDYYILLNDDTEVFPDCIAKLYEAVRMDESIGIMGSCPVESSIWPYKRHGSVIADLLGGHTLIAHDNAPYLLSTYAVQFHCVLITKELIQAIGLLDESFFNFCSDTDYCLRAKMANFRVCYRNDAMLIHRGNKTVERVESTLTQDQRYFVYKWFGAGLNRILENIPIDKMAGLKAKMQLILDGEPQGIEKFKKKFGLEDK